MTSEIRVLSTIGMRTVVEALAPDFERRNDCAIAWVYDSSVALMQRIADGESGDAAVFTAAAIDQLIAQGKVAARIDLARSFVGIAVKRGAPHPDIATPDAFRAALLAAKSVARSKTGASGLYFASLIERLGLGEAMKTKMVVRDGLVGRLAARGECEIAVQQISELMQADGIDIVGPLPEALQSVTMFSGGVFTASRQAALAHAFIAALAAPAHAGLIRQKGMDRA